MLINAWWPRVVRAVFKPVLGKALLDEIGSDELAPLDADETYAGYFNGWDGQLESDLSLVLGKHLPRGAPKDAYCGGGELRKCRSLLRRTLAAAIDSIAKKHGADMSKWQYPVLCDNPRNCDENTLVTAGAVETPPQPFENRGTYQQAVEIPAHVPR